MSGNRVVLATFGTHGDLHPFMAVALGLKQHGFDPVIASSDHFQADVETAGLRFHALRPSLARIESDLRMSRPQMLRAVRQQPQIMMTKFILPYLRESYEDAIAAIADASVVLTSSIAYGAKLAAEKLGCAHFGVVLQPYTLISAFDPPVIGNAQRLSRIVYRAGIATTRAFFRFGRRVAANWAGPIYQLRAQLGLPRTPLHPFFEGQFIGGCPIGLYSRVLGDVQPDFPAGFVLAGFAFYDGSSQEVAVSEELERFISAGSPPTVFTRGTSAVHDSGPFARAALQAIRLSGERAILVLDDEQRALLRDPSSRDVLVTGYLPYSKIFGRCKTIVHHGGIGTTAQALRSGRPQLICPYFVDQPDNAARVERLGAARVLPPRHWTARRIADELLRIDADSTMSINAARVARQVSDEPAVETVVRLVVDAAS